MLLLLLLLAQAPDAPASELALLPDGGLPPLTEDGGLPHVADFDAGFSLLVAEEAGEDAGVDAEPGEEPLTAPPNVTPVAPPLSMPLRIAISQALVGRFATNTCERPAAESPFERLSARFAGATAGRGPPPLLFDAGDLLGTSAIGRLAVDADVTRLSEAVAALGLQARALGRRDLAGGREQLIGFTRALGARGVPTVLTNLWCEGDATALCDVVMTGDEAPLLIDTVAGRVAFIAAVSPAALRELAQGPGRGITLTPPADAIAEATRRARALGADRVVAIYDPATGAELDDTLALSRALDAESIPDVIFVSGVADRFSSALTASGNALLVATRPAEVVLAELRDVHAHTHTLALSTPVAPAPAIADYARDLNHALCERYDVRFSGGKLPKPLERADAAALVLDVLRAQARAEVALVNAASISPNAPWPLREALTPLDLMQVLPFDNTLRTTALKGAKLTSLLAAATARGYFIRGAVKGDAGWKINGRAVESDQQYRVVTSDFVVDKLGEEFGKPAPVFRSVAGGTVRDLVTAWLGAARAGEELANPVDPARRTRWALTYRLQLDLTSVSVSNPDTAIFTDTQLARGQALSLVGETEFRAIGDHPAYSIDHDARLRYGIARTIGTDGTNSGLQNNVDLLTARTLAYARTLFGPSRWYLPRPYADVYLESELTRPDTRPYHHLQLLPQGGVRFELVPTFSLYVGGGMTWEVFARAEQLTPPVPPAAGVLVGGWLLKPTRLVQLGERWVELESNLDVFARDLGGPAQVQARGRVRLFFPLFSVLSLTATYDLFLRYVRTGAVGAWKDQVGVSNDVYVGLSVALGQSFQSFAF